MSISRGHPVVAALSLACLILSGCQAIAWTAAQFAPPEKVKALYELPKGKSVLVFVDDSARQIEYVPVKAKLTEALGEQLLSNNAADRTVPYQRLLDLMTSSPDFDRLSVSEVGRRCGADVVLYVQIEQFQLREHPDSPLWQGKLQASIRVVDVQQGRLWPTDRPDGYPIGPVETPLSAESSPGYESKLSNLLAERLADKIAKCFYDHERPRGAFADEDNTPWFDGS